MSRRTKIKEQIRRERRRQKQQRLGIVGGILIIVVLFVLIGVAIWEHREKKDDEDSSMQPQEKEEIVCDNFSSFSGQYVEDGSDSLVENVASMLVTNQTDRFLDLATLEYEIDGKKATFVVTGLPAGKSAWVMEENKMSVTDESEFKYIDRTTSYKDGVTAETDKISISSEGNMLTVVNMTEETLEGVFIYYKALHTDGNYFGGITYMVTFGDLEPGEKRTNLAGHYDEDSAEIVRIGWKEK